MITHARKPSALRREEIADAILRIIGDRGLPAVTITVIAAEVGLSSGALFRHFASREEMLDLAVRQGLARIDTTYPSGPSPPLELLLELARRRIRLLGSDPGLSWLLRSDEALLTLPRSAVSAIKKVAARSKGYILDALREAAAEGSIRCDIDAEILLVPFVGTVHALIGVRGAQRFATADMEAHTEEVLQALVRLFQGCDGNQRPEATSGSSIK